MNDEQLIELVRQFSVLYDSSHPKYMDSGFKLEIWNKIGEEMNVDGSSCKARWNNIRDNYRKSLKKALTTSCQSVKKVKLYKYSEQLSFLTKYFDERATNGNIDLQTPKEDYQDDSAQHYVKVEYMQDDQGEPAESDHEDFQSQSLSSPKRKNSFEVPKKSTIRKSITTKVASQQTVSEKLMEYLIRKNENQADVTSSSHPVDVFLAGLAPTLKTLTPYYLNLAKSEIFASVQKYEMKMIAEQHSNEFGNPDSNFPHNLTSQPTSSSPLSSPVPQFQ